MHRLLYKTAKRQKSVLFSLLFRKLLTPTNREKRDSMARGLSRLVGNAEAVAALRAVTVAASRDDRRLPHILFHSRIPGSGKTESALAVAEERNVPLMEVMPPFNGMDFLALCNSVGENGVVFIDEIHGLGKASDWLLPWMESGKLITPVGPMITPDVSLLAATTDIQKLAPALLGRFTLQILMKPYSTEEAKRIALVNAKKINLHLDDDTAEQIAKAARCNPRQVTRIVKLTKDAVSAYQKPPREVLSQVMKWCDLLPDGTPRSAIDYLQILKTSPGMQASAQTLRARLTCDPVMLEAILMDDGLIGIAPRGRRITALGLKTLDAWHEMYPRP
jgi:holliday junction DNA helicase RuvB